MIMYLNNVFLFKILLDDEILSTKEKKGKNLIINELRISKIGESKPNVKQLIMRLQEDPKQNTILFFLWVIVFTIFHIFTLVSRIYILAKKKKIVSI